MMKTVFLFSKWYPTAIKPLLGNFVENHAKALSIFARVIVIHPYESNANITGGYRIDQTQNNSLIEIRIAFCPILIQGFTGKLIRNYRYFTSYKKGIRYAVNKFGLPDFCHVNILTRPSLPALWLKHKYGIQYAVTEHSTRYLPQKNSYKGWIRKMITRYAVKNAISISAVTSQLRDAMIEQGINHQLFNIIPNVVDTTHFHPEPTTHSLKTILHISGLTDHHKNISGILRTIAELSKKRTDFKLVMIGDGPDRNLMELYATSLGIKDRFVYFMGEIPNDQIPSYVNNSDFHLLFSNFETQGLVLIESFACGKPVIATRTGGIIDTVTAENGILVSPQDENQLLNTINYMLDNYKSFDAEAIRNYAVQHFSCQHVGNQLYQLFTLNSTENA